MTNRLHIKTILLIALVAISLDGFLVHSRIHSALEPGVSLVPPVCGILSIIVVPLLFSFRKTIDYGYVLNGFLVIIGAITMVHYSIVHWPHPAGLKLILLKTTFPDILVLASKLFIGKALFDLEMFGYTGERAARSLSYQYPNLGWWLVHFTGGAVVYWLGNALWR